MRTCGGGQHIFLLSGAYMLDILKIATKSYACTGAYMLDILKIATKSLQAIQWGYV